MIVVGGATRLTDSGLSITEWRPVTGAVPPLSDAGWAAEFEKYRRIPEYRYVNAGMSLAEFKTIFWWEWGHRFLGRIIGLAFAAPFLVFLAARRIPRGLVGRCWLLLGLGGLQGAVGWWMVSSGLSERVDVAPERLTVHLGLALVLLGALVWTALDAWRGPAKGAGRGAPVGAYGLFALVFVQCLLGGLVAGNDAGRVYTDWPLMSGRLFPAEYAHADGLWRTVTHSLAAVQLHHRLTGYLLFVVGWAFLAFTVRRTGRALNDSAAILAVVVTGQMLLGVVTLISAAPVGLGILHQAGAVLTFAAATVLAWTARRNPGRDEVLATAWTERRGSAKGAADTMLGAAT
ncbi:MAG: COX15/CtaA family protein [Proteobacteria bacterium]|nr:COX15/CtaA family protein [Pseudomonadota bacterium]